MQKKYSKARELSNRSYTSSIENVVCLFVRLCAHHVSLTNWIQNRITKRKEALLSVIFSIYFIKIDQIGLKDIQFSSLVRNLIAPRCVTRARCCKSGVNYATQTKSRAPTSIQYHLVLFTHLFHTNFNHSYKRHILNGELIIYMKNSNIHLPLIFLTSSTHNNKLMSNYLTESL